MITIRNKVSEQVVGKKCNRFRLIEGGTLILYLNSSTNTELSDYRIWIDCAWRLRDSKSIKVGSLDESDIVLKELYVLKDLTLELVDVDRDTGDLRLLFQGGTVIETFGYSIADEHWELRRSDGLRIGVGPSYQAFERFEEADHKSKVTDLFLKK